MSDRFLLDANAFIEPRDRYYSYDICPGYWTALAQQHTVGCVISIDRVRGELVPKSKDDWDDIAEWIERKIPSDFFKQTKDLAVIEKFQEIVNWVYNQSQFSDPAKAEFASVADGWLVAYAAQNEMTVVTHEEYAPEAKRKVPIPNMCLEFDVAYQNTFEMLRDLRVKLIQSTKRRRKR